MHPADSAEERSVAYESVRTPGVAVEGQPRVNLVPPQNDRKSSEHPVEEVPNRTVQVALVRAEDSNDGLEDNENEDSNAELGVERFFENVEVIDGDREGRDHQKDTDDLDTWWAKNVSGN